MRCKLLLLIFSLFIILHFSLFAQDTSSTDSKTETTSSQEVEKSDSQDNGDVSEKEQKEDVVVEDVIIEEESEEDIIEEEDISEDVVTEEDIIEEVPKEKVVKEENVEEEDLEKEEPKEGVVAEEKPKEEVVTEEDVTEEEVPDKEKSKEEIVVEDKKIDTVKSPDVTPEEDKVIEESVEIDEGAEEEKDTVSKEVAVEEEDMDIILEEDEDLLIVDDEEELFITDEPEETTVVEEEPLKEKEDTVTAEIISSEEAGEQPLEEEAPVSPEIIETEGVVVGEPEAVTSALPGKGKPSKQTKIERARSIDFAKNLKDYRSPKKAMFMSLLLPGLGQAYTKKYWKTALFGAIEASLIGFAVKHAVDGRDKKKDAQKFADNHFNVDTFFTFYEDFEQLISPESIDVDIYMIFDTLSNYKNKFTPEKLKDYESDERKDFDDVIGSDAFVQGWDDCEPSFSSSGFNTNDSTDTYYFRPYNTTDSMWVLYMYEIGSNTLVRSGVFGYSKYQDRYNDMVSLSDHYYKVSTVLIFFIVANHVASAVDAFISARAFNDKLLHKESLWQRIDIDHQIAFAQDGFHSRFGIRVRF